MKKGLVLFVSVGLVAAGLFSASCTKNELPVIDTFEVEPASDTLITAGDTVELVVEVSDVEGDSIQVILSAEAGLLGGTVDGQDLYWVSPDTADSFGIVCTVTDRDTTIDTLSYVADTIYVHVQNYFPMQRGYTFKYDGFIWLITNIPKSIARKVYSKEDREGGETVWHIETKDSTSDKISIDSLDFYTVTDRSSVFESVRIYTRISQPSEGIICQMPLWEGKTWEYNEDGTAEVIEILDRGTSNLSFIDCAHIEITFPGDSALVRTIWFAPDVGIIEDKLESDGSEVFDFELVEYEFE